LERYAHPLTLTEQSRQAEELNRFREEDVGKHWGYPFCWTEFNLPVPPGLGKGTVWAWPTFLDTVDDATCRFNYVPPVISMQGHAAPLGITFYEWKPFEERPSNCPNASFPREMDGYAFIAFHGSSDRDVPTGYKVVYVAMDPDGNAIGEPVNLLSHTPPKAQWDDGFRPVDVDFDACGRLLVSSDGTRANDFLGSKIIRMEYVASTSTSPEASSPGHTTNSQSQPCS